VPGRPLAADGSTTGSLLRKSLLNVAPPAGELVCVYLEDEDDEQAFA
jgi:hypothetical protein